jgi:hypothetical protein
MITVGGTITVEDFTPDQVAIFDEMHRVLTEYNAKLETNPDTPMPNYTPDEVAAYSQYRELLLESKYLNSAV